MHIERPSGQFEYWNELWVSQKPLIIDGKKWVVATIACADVCSIKLTEI